MYDEIPNLLPFHSSQDGSDHLPPRFPTKQIQTPIAIFYGGSDSLVNFEVLSADLPELAYVKYIAEWEHLDFLWAEGVELHVWPDVIRLVNSFNPAGNVSTHEVPHKAPNSNGYENGVVAWRRVLSICVSLRIQACNQYISYADYNEFTPI